MVLLSYHANSAVQAACPSLSVLCCLMRWCKILSIVAAASCKYTTQFIRGFLSANALLVRMSLYPLLSNVHSVQLFHLDQSLKELVNSFTFCASNLRFDSCCLD